MEKAMSWREAMERRQREDLEPPKNNPKAEIADVRMENAMLILENDLLKANLKDREKEIEKLKRRNSISSIYWLMWSLTWSITWIVIYILTRAGII